MATHLITGAGSGIGEALAAALAERGDELVLIARNEARAAELAERFPAAETLVADLGRPELILPALRGRLPDRLDSVVHCAGDVLLGAVGTLGVALWRHTLDVNLVAPAQLTLVALPALRAAGGRVVFVNSGAGLSASAEWGAYAASKFGLRALADSLREEERAAGVRVTSIYPGRTATPMQEWVHQQERLLRQDSADYSADDWIAPESVAATILTALDLPRDADLTELRVRPGR